MTEKNSVMSEAREDIASDIREILEAVERYAEMLAFDKARYSYSCEMRETADAREKMFAVARRCGAKVGEGE